MPTSPFFILQTNCFLVCNRKTPVWQTASHAESIATGGCRHVVSGSLLAVGMEPTHTTAYNLNSVDSGTIGPPAAPHDWKVKCTLIVSASCAWLSPMRPIGFKQHKHGRATAPESRTMKCGSRPFLTSSPAKTSVE